MKIDLAVLQLDNIKAMRVHLGVSWPDKIEAIARVIQMRADLMVL